MELGKTSKFLKFSIFLCSALIFNAGYVNCSEIKQFFGDEEIKVTNFDNVFFKNTVSFEDYDSYSNQFDNFFGMNYLETENKRNFQDLAISIDSKNLRDLFENMLEGQTTIKRIKKDKEVFFKEKI